MKIKRILLFLCIAVLMVAISVSAYAVSASQVKVSKDNLIVPGVSLGKIKLGMTTQQVTSLLGAPSSKNANTMIYFSKDKKNYIKLYIKGAKVYEIAFTSNSFKMAMQDMSVDNISWAYFNGFIWKQHLTNLKFNLKTGGLSVYRFNVDRPDVIIDYFYRDSQGKKQYLTYDEILQDKNNTRVYYYQGYETGNLCSITRLGLLDADNYKDYSVGMIYAGKNPINEPVPNSKWKVWDMRSDYNPNDD